MLLDNRNIHNMYISITYYVFCLLSDVPFLAIKFPFWKLSTVMLPVCISAYNRATTMKHVIVADLKYIRELVLLRWYMLPDYIICYLELKNALNKTSFVFGSQSEVSGRKALLGKQSLQYQIRQRTRAFIIGPKHVFMLNSINSGNYSKLIGGVFLYVTYIWKRIV